MFFSLGLVKTTVSCAYLQVHTLNPFSPYLKGCTSSKVECKGHFTAATGPSLKSLSIFCTHDDFRCFCNCKELPDFSWCILGRITWPKMSRELLKSRSSEIWKVPTIVSTGPSLFQKFLLGEKTKKIGPFFTREGSSLRTFCGIEAPLTRPNGGAKNPEGSKAGPFSYA
jgi:hypothetical protein